MKFFKIILVLVGVFLIPAVTSAATMVPGNLENEAVVDQEKEGTGVSLKLPKGWGVADVIRDDEAKQIIFHSKKASSREVWISVVYVLNIKKVDFDSMVKNKKTVTLGGKKGYLLSKTEKSGIYLKQFIKEKIVFTVLNLLPNVPMRSSIKVS